MTYDEETELLELTRENNAMLKATCSMLKAILQYVKHDDSNDFITNVIANIVGNRIDGGIGYARKL